MTIVRHVASRRARPDVAAATPTLRDALPSRSRGEPLSTETRTSMERRFGHDFAAVRVHADADAAEAARGLGASAYSVGDHIVFGDGRYAPGSRDGRRLLGHELAHHAHRAEATDRRPGVAPEDAVAEREARAAADDVVAAAPGPRPRFDRWGPAWDVHREVKSVKTLGTAQHTGDVGASPDGKTPPVGRVAVRTGEEVEISGGGRLPNMIAIAYSGSLTPDSHWLQFVWFEMVATTPQGTAHYNGDLAIPGDGSKALSNDPKAPSWTIDTTSGSNPFYEAGYANLRKDNATTIFDSPGGASVQPLADAIYQSGDGSTAVTFTAHFETYLIQKNAAVYRVAWQASTAFTRSGGATRVGAIGYTVGASGPQQGLPADRKATLDAAFPRSRGIR